MKTQLILTLLVLSMIAMPLAMAAQQGQLATGAYTNQAGDAIQVQNEEGNFVKLKSGGIEAVTNMIMTQEQNKLQVKLSNGLNAEIKVMPDVASETALQRLGAKCESTCTIELKEIRTTTNEAKLAYEIKTQKQVKLLGLFDVQLPVQAQINAESGEVIQTKKSWWAFLTNESI